MPPPSAGAGEAFDGALHHVQLAIPPGSEDECRRFYVGVLGMTGVKKPAPMVSTGGLWVRAGSVELHLGVERDFRPARKAHPGILVSDVDGLARRLETRGIEVAWDERFPGYRRFYVHDNLGNRLEFLAASREEHR